MKSIWIDVFKVIFVLTLNSTILSPLTYDMIILSPPYSWSFYMVINLFDFTMRVVLNILPLLLLPYNGYLDYHGTFFLRHAHLIEGKHCKLMPIEMLFFHHEGGACCMWPAFTTCSKTNFVFHFNRSILGFIN